MRGLNFGRTLPKISFGKINMNAKILFVDDEQNVLDGLRRLLHPKYNVFTALGGEDGLRVMASSGPFSVIIADMRMPKMNGIEFLTKAKQVDPLAVLMMLTGNADRETAQDAVQKGKVFQFLTKPCTEDRLIKAIESGIEMGILDRKLSQINAA